MAGRASITRARFDSIDLLRGLVMVIMVLDHTRDYVYVGSFGIDPTDTTHSVRHVMEPTVTLGGADRVGRVAQAQPRMAPRPAVGVGSAPVLDQEPAQASLGTGEVLLGVQGS